MSDRSSTDEEEIFYDAQEEVGVLPSAAQRFAGDLQAADGEPPVPYLPPEEIPLPPSRPASPAVDGAGPSNAGQQRRVRFDLPPPSSSTSAASSPPRPPAPLPPFRSQRPDAAYRGAATLAQRLRLFREPANLLDLAAGVGAAIMARTSTPVAWWTIFVGVSTVVNTALALRVSREQNPLLLHYLGLTGLPDPNLGRGHSATESYFRRQLLTGVVDASFATVALVGGHDFGGTGSGSQAHAVLGPVFNSAIHVRAVAESGWSLWQVCDDALVTSDDRVLNDWVRQFKEIKGTRLAFRTGHALLPAEPNNWILGMLATATGVRLGVAWTVGDFYQAMAQHIHFKAYQEARLLPRSTRRVILRSGRGISIPPNRDPGMGPQNRPYTRFVHAIFARDLWHYGDGFVDDLIRDPAGWNAIAHRFVVL